MVSKKHVSLLTITLILLTLIFTGCSKQKVKEPVAEKIVKIGITQIVEHPALDAARQGFLDALKSKGFEESKNLNVEFKNAQGEIASADTIAQSFASQKKDLILAIATPTAQAAYNATKDIPILITAVTDPVKSGLAKSLEKSETNVTGTSDAIPIEKQFKLLKTLVPNAKRIGIIYNTSEGNSEIQVESAKKAAPAFGLEIVPVGITSTNDIPLSLNSIFGKVDALYIPTDNMVASAMTIVSAKCNEKKLPIIAAEKGMVEGGALATEGIDYYKLGFQTGLVAFDIINGKSPKDIPIKTLEDTELFINTDTAKILGIVIPDELKAKAKLITSGTK